MEISSIDLDYLGTRRDARKIDEAAVRGLVDSIAEVGIINPIRVRPKRLYIHGVEGDGFEVIAGAHRLRAAKLLGLAEVPCIVVDDDDIDAEIAMIDENLSRAELSPADRASQTKRRKVLYLKKHPETAAGVAGAAARWSDANDNLSAASFSAETAARTKKSERSIQRDASRGESIAQDVLDRVAGTHLDSGAYLDRLKGLPHDAQRARVERALAEPAAAPAKPAPALSDAEVIDKQFMAIVSAWNKAGPEARDRFKDEYVEHPIMDRQYGVGS